MENTQTNGNKNGANPRWKKQVDKEKFTEDEMELIRTSRAVMKVIEKQIERGDFDEYLKKKDGSEK